MQISAAQKRDFIYATDAADLFVRLLLSRENGAFIIDTGHATTIRFVVQYLAALAQRLNYCISAQSRPRQVSFRSWWPT